MQVWPFMPQVGPTRSVEWNTDIIQCKAAEQRVSLRAIPREGSKYTYLMSEAEYAQAKQLALDNSDKDILLPLWVDFIDLPALLLGATTAPLPVGHSVAPGEVYMLWDNGEWEEVTIDSVEAELVTFTMGTIRPYQRPAFVKLEVAMFDQAFSAPRKAFKYIEASASFITVFGDATSATPFAQYQGHDLVIDRPILSGSITESYEREVDVLDPGVGIVWQGPKFTFPLSKAVLTWEPQTRQELKTLRLWLNSKRGKWKGFWVPSWSNDIAVLDILPSSQARISGNYLNKPLPWDIVVFKGSTAYPRRVTAYTYEGSNRGVVTLNSAMPSGLLDLVCQLTFMRFDSDRYEVKYSNSQASAISIPVREIPYI